MSELKQPISQMMSELEMKAADFRRKKINEKVEQIKREQSDILAQNFTDAFCLIKSALEAGGDPDDLVNKMVDFKKLRSLSFDPNENTALFKIEESLIDTNIILKRFYKDNTLNIFNEVLQRNVILPKLNEAMKAIDAHFTKFDIFPGNFNYNQLVKGCPHWLRVSQGTIKDNEILITEERPKVFYTMASQPFHDASEGAHGWGELENAEQQDEYFEMYREWKDEKGLYLVGLTSSEYIYLQLARQYNITPVPPFYGGWDEKCGCLLLGEQVKNTKTQKAAYSVGFWDNSGREQSKLNSGAEILILRDPSNFDLRLDI